MPVVGVLAPESRRGQESKTEREVKEALSTCLSENGYTVAGWTPEEAEPG
jgi:hypothetical protein